MQDEELPPDAIPPAAPEPSDAAPEASPPPAENPPPSAPLASNSGGLPAIPFIPPPNKQALEDRRRLRHRRKRYTLYVLRNHRRRQEERSRGRRRAIFFIFGAFLALIVGTISTATAAAYSYYQSELPALLAIPHQVNSSDSVQIFDMHGTLIYQANYSGVKHSIPFSQIPLTVINATVSIEDKDFWNNDGIDLQRILSAAYTDYVHHQVDQGASTITQQLIKQTVLDSNQSYDRKIREAILAYGLTTSNLYNPNFHLNKQEILTLYLDTIPYGPDIYSIDSAAYQYFGYTDNLQTGEAAAHHLDLAQASFLAAIPQNPNIYDPQDPLGFQRALGRQQLVLAGMIRDKYITPAQAAAATKEANAPGFIHPPPDTRYTNLAPHFVQFVIDELNTMITNGQLNPDAAPGELKAARSGLKIYTTLDLPLQQQVQQIMADHLFCSDVDAYGTHLFDDNVSETAAVLAQQSTGDLRVLLGSWDYYMSKTPTQCSYHKAYFKNGKYYPSTSTPNPGGKAVHNQNDAARFAFRSPGSTFKALDYSTAFEMGWYPAMTLDDVPTVFPDPGGPTGAYKPLDAEGLDYDGEMTIRHALQHSMDIPAIKAADFVGVPNLLRTMGRVGVGNVQNVDYNGTPGLAMAIGSLGVHPFNMVQAYATYANYGRKVPFNGIDYILDGEGNKIYQYSPPRGDQVFSPQVSYLLTNVLSDNKARTGNHGFGGCSPLYLYYDGKTNPGFYGDLGQTDCDNNVPGVVFPAAAKTGTTDNLADDWTMGYTMDYTGGVWVGNDLTTDYMHDIDGITGAAPIWWRMMIAAEMEKTTIGVGVDHTPTQFPVPQGISRAKYSSNNITTEDYFLTSNVPHTQGTGNGGPTKVCVIQNDNNANDPWDYCSGPPPKPKP